jgi:hypothetical protein
VSFEWTPRGEGTAPAAVECVFTRLRGSDALAYEADAAKCADDFPALYLVALARLASQVQSLSFNGERITVNDWRETLDTMGVEFVFALLRRVREESHVGAMLPKSNHSPAA